MNRDNKEIDCIRYTLSAKAKGKSVDKVDIDLSSYKADFKVYKPNPKNTTYDVVNTVDASASGIVSPDLDDSWHIIWTVDRGYKQ